MAGSIQGLTVVINGDATPLTKAMRQAKSEATTLRTHMAALNKLIKFDPSSMALITRQQQLMNAQLAQAASRMAMLKEAEREFYASVGPHSEAEIRQFQRLQREITECELQMAMLRQQAIQMGLGASASTLQWAGRLEKASTALGKISTQALAVSAAVGFLGAMAVKSAYEFEQSFAGVRKTIIATDEEYAKLARDTRDIALVKPIDVNDVNEIMMYAGQLNIANEHLTKFASVMADLDVATDMDLEEGSMQLARFMNICNTGQGDVDRLGATIVDLGNNSATTESQIMLMAMRIAGTASNVGFTEQNILALAAALSATGIQAEMGGNAIATIIRRIDKDVDKGTASLSTWASVAGMSASEFASSWKTDVAGTFQKIISGMGDFQDAGGSLNLLLDELHISYMRQVDVMQRVSRSGDMLSALFARADTAWANNTALVREATQRYDTAASKTKMMMNAFNELGITLGNEILPHFKDVVLTVTGAVQAFAKMDDGTKTLVVNTMAFVTAGGLAINALKLLTGTGATAIRFLASMKTALGLASVSQLSYNNMVIMSTAAMTGNTAALEANNLAKVQNMTFTEALTGAVSQMGARFAAAATSIGMSTIAFTGAAAAAVAVVAGLVLVAKYLEDTASYTDKLTAASRKNQDALDESRARYYELAETQGETADATLEALAAVEEQEAAFEQSKETVGEFCDRMLDLSEAHEKTKGSMRDSAAEAESQAGAMLLTAKNIKELVARQDDDIERKAKISSLVDSLNKQVDGLNLTYDANTNTLKSNADAWEAVVKAQADKLRNDAYLKNYNSTIAESIELDAALAEMEEELASITEDQIRLGADEYSARLNAINIINSNGNAYSQLKNSIAENSAEQEKWLRKMDEANLKAAAVEYALELVNTALYSEDDAVAAANEALGTSIELGDLHAKKLTEEAEAAAEAAEESTKLVEAITELSAEYPFIIDMLNEAGVSIDGFAEMLQNAGVSAEDFGKGCQDMADKVQDGLNRIEVNQEITLDKFMENLQHNREVVNNWADNTRTAFANAGSDSARKFIGYIYSLGPEYAGLMEELAGKTTEELNELGDQFDQGGADAVRAYMAQFEHLPGLVVGTTTETRTGATNDFTIMQAQLAALSTTTKSQTVATFALMASGALSRADLMRQGVIASFGKMNSGVGSQLPTTQSNADTAASSIASINRWASYMYGWGQQTLRNMISGIDSKQGSMTGTSNTISGIIASINRYSGSMYSWGKETVNNYIRGMEAAQVAKTAANIASTIQSYFGHSVPKEGPLHNRGKGEAGWGEESMQNYIDGMLSKSGALSAAASSLSEIAAGAFLPSGEADWDAATRTTIDPYTAQTALMAEWQLSLESTVTKWLDERLGPTIAEWTPVVSTRDFARMVNEVSNG